jgi:membrane protease YdiL (CAAX protease family)
MTGRLPSAVACELASVRRHPFVAAGVAATAAAVAWIECAEGSGVKGVVYLATMLVAALVASAVVLWRSEDAPALPVRRPGRETVVLSSLLAVGVGVLVLARDFPAVWEKVPLHKPLQLAGLVFLFQIAAVAYLLGSRYRLGELGLRPAGVLVPAFVLPLVAGAAVAVDPGGVTLPMILREMGWLGLVSFALFGEPLVEEFLRLWMQTRAGALLSNPAAGWFLAAWPWALLHVPVWYANSHDLGGAVAGAVRIVPIGLLWGFVTHRTRSLIPSLLLHGFNVWGLQNP